jgi:hypothetical protein
VLNADEPVCLKALQSAASRHPARIELRRDHTVRRQLAAWGIGASLNVALQFGRDAPPKRLANMGLTGPGRRFDVDFGSHARLTGDGVMEMS